MGNYSTSSTSTYNATYADGSKEDLTTRKGIIEAWNRNSGSEQNFRRLVILCLLDIRDELKQANEDAPEPEAPTIGWAQE